MADIGIVDDTIAAIGFLDDASAHNIIDASGLAVAPGFINVLSWANGTLIEDGRSQANIRQGVTLEVIGEGTSYGPLTDTMKAELQNSQGDIKYDVTWSTFGEWLEAHEARGVSPNVASFLGAKTTRIHELGWDDVDPTPEQLDRMRALVAQSMREGAPQDV